jgi:hypothetical protein
MTMSTSRRGAQSEMIACVWLVSQGFDVFRSTHPDGIGDIVAYKNNGFLIIDVKSWSTDKKRGQMYHAALSKKQISHNVRLLLVNPISGECELLPANTASGYRSIGVALTQVRGIDYKRDYRAPPIIFEEVADA